MIRPMTISEKILAEHAGLREVEPGQLINAKVDLVLANDITQSPDYVELRPGIQSEISVPIQYAQSVVGVINLESRKVNAFTSEHVNFLKALAAQAAIAIGNAQRLEEYRDRGELLRRRAEQLTNLFQIGQAFRGDAGHGRGQAGRARRTRPRGPGWQTPRQPAGRSPRPWP